MRYKNGSGAFPRLVVEDSEAYPGEQVGFLEVRDVGQRVEVGRAAGREFLLLQCLFSPRNFVSARYEPVLQTHERLFGAIRMTADSLNARLSRRESSETEMAAIVEKSLCNLREGGVGEYFAFVSQEGRIRMELA